MNFYLDLCITKFVIYIFIDPNVICAYAKGIEKNNIRVCTPSYVEDVSGVGSPVARFLSGTFSVYILTKFQS